MRPSTPQEIISPAVTVTNENQRGSIPVSVFQYQRYNNSVSNNGREHSQETVGFQLISTKRADECGNGTENDIRQGAACEHVADNTANK